jgi:lipoprotein-anchoring transpeptidase ErfK/SrfK
MNIYTSTLHLRRTAWFSTVLTLGLFLTPAWADIRQEAVSAISRLHQSDIIRDMPDEVRSADTTFATAEHYYQSDDPELSDRFYLLTLQKARVILTSLPAGISGKVAPEPSPIAETVPTPTVTIPVAEQSPLPAEPPLQVTPATPTQPADIPIQNTYAQPPPVEVEPFSDDVTSDKLVGRSNIYTVVSGDTIRLVSAKLGVSRQHIISLNKLDAKAYLKVGQKLRYNNRKIVPQRMKDGIVVNIPDRMLYYFKKGKLAVSIPVALGVPVKSEKYDWKTPTGKFKITAKAKDPTWHVPPSIQSEMEDQGKEVITSIPPGPTNPLGKYAIKTSIPGILIHSTTKPWSIYSFASHGCIRVYPEQMEELFKEISVNTQGEIIYRPVKLAVTEEGRVFLEVHQDVYGKSTGLAKEARLQIEKQNLGERVDWKKVDSVLRQKLGIAEDISL